MFSLKSKSTQGITSCQVFVSDKGLVAVYLMRLQEQLLTSLHLFCKQVGVPDILVVDGRCAQTSNEVKKNCDQVGTNLKILDTATPLENRAEL